MSLTIFVNTIVITVLHIDFEPLGSPKTDSTPKINPQQWVDHPESPITFDGPSTRKVPRSTDLEHYISLTRKFSGIQCLRTENCASEAFTMGFEVFWQIENRVLSSPSVEFLFIPPLFRSQGKF